MSQVLVVGTVVHIRKMSKKISFFDVLKQSETPSEMPPRVTVVLKLWVCGQKVMDDARSGPGKIHAGDVVSFTVASATFEDAFEALDFKIERRYADHSGGKAFVPIPPSAPQSSAPNRNQGPCKYYLNSGCCPRESSCPFLHCTVEQELSRNRVEYVNSRRRNRMETQLARRAEEVDADHEQASLLSRHQRSSVFAKWLVKKYPDILLHGANSNDFVLDVAGGRGDLAFELKAKAGVVPTIATVDPREQKLRRWQVKLLRRIELNGQTKE